MAAAAAVERVNSKFSAAYASDIVTFPRRPMIKPDDKIFTIGSCFAEEVGKALTNLGFDVYPHYRDLVFDDQRLKVDELPEREHMN